MTSNTTTIRYSKLSITLHWLMFLLIVAAYATINLHEGFPKGSDAREFLKSLHFMLGLGILCLVFIRIAGRMISVAPMIKPELSNWQKRTSKITHVLLYALMISMPILGWLTLSAAGKTIPFYGFTLPSLIAQNKELASIFKEIHENIGTFGYFLIGIHTVAALFHHYIKRDNTLIRMLPKFKN